jgi:hypothetical protein
MDDGSALVSHPDPHRAVRSLAALHGFNDPYHRGELAQVFDGAGRSLRFLRPTGVSLDRFGEILFDQGVTNRRMAPDDVWKLLSATFDSRGTSAPVRKAPSVRAREKAIRKAQKNRQFKFQCPEATCRQIARASRNTLLDCGLCREVEGRTVAMVRVEPTMEELMASD